jgi:DNA repair exonuclease SbcCD ATPase subunit
MMQPEIEAMIGVIEAERKKVGKQWEVINAANGKLKAKKESLREDKKLIEDAMHKFAKAERSLDKRLTEADSLAEAASNVREDCQRMTEECKAIETARSKVISEAKAEAVQRLEAVERESQRLEAIREAANKERRRLLHTRTAVLCTRCQSPLVEAGDTKELSNLGLRTAGDGETVRSSNNSPFLLL